MVGIGWLPFKTWVVMDNIWAINGLEVDLRTMDGKFMINHVGVAKFMWPHFPVRNILMLPHATAFNSYIYI